MESSEDESEEEEEKPQKKRKTPTKKEEDDAMEDDDDSDEEPSNKKSKAETLTFSFTSLPENQLDDDKFTKWLKKNLEVLIKSCLLSINYDPFLKKFLMVVKKLKSSLCEQIGAAEKHLSTSQVSSKKKF